MEQLIEQFDYSPDRIHCANCQNAKVSGKPTNPNVTCDIAKQEMPLRQMIRGKYARGFVNAAKCRGFTNAAH